MFAGLLFTAASVAYASIFGTSWGRASLPSLVAGVPILYAGCALKVVPILTLAAIASYGLKRLPPSFRAYGLATRNGLLISAIGDVAMDLADAGSEVAFIGGMGAFLIAHIAYAYGLLQNRGKHDFVLLLGSYAPSLAVLNMLYKHMVAKPDTAQLLPAVVVYMVALTFIFYAAALRRTEALGPRNGSLSYWLAVGGAATFMLSDCCIAFDRFAPPPRTADGAVRWWFMQPKLVVMVTYYGAQAMITGAVWAAGSDAAGAGTGKAPPSGKPAAASAGSARGATSTKKAQ